MIVSAWNVSDVDKMAIPPCHTMFQFYVADNKLSCQLYQRSADIFLGVPFNIASYALLTHMVAQVCNLGVGDFVHTFGDAHLYLNHIEQTQLQLSRECFKLPQIKINPDVKDIFGFKFEDFELLNYEAIHILKHQWRFNMRISLIVAKSENNAIGLDNKLPWHLKDDLQNFKKLTMGHHILMGRKTFESIGKALPGRMSLVVSSEPRANQDAVFWFNSIFRAIKQAERNGETELFIIGGEKIYKYALSLIDRIYLTEVKATSKVMFFSLIYH